MSLNAEQTVAVNAREGNILCIAGPGSGKTRVIVERYLKMLESGVSPDHILSLTFTKQAAKEMGQRGGFGSSQTVFRTFHSFALDFLKKERSHLSFTLSPEVLPEPNEQYEVTLSIVISHQNRFSYKELVEAISAYKRDGVSPEEAVEKAYGVEMFLASGYSDYEKKSRKAGWLDFDSIMWETVKLLESNEEVRARYQFKYVQVDEGQDTDTTQLRLLALITQNIFVVGDDNQLIYEWRSAKPGLESQFATKFKGLQKLFLGTNYRCHPPGTLIDCWTKNVGKYGSRGPTTVVEKICIENVSSSHKAVSWDKRSWHFYLRGQETEKFEYNFKGGLIEIETETGKRVSVTPNHDLFVCFDKNLCAGKYVVYLMWKKEFGFRIGQTSFITINKKGELVVRFWHRIHMQKPDKIWILSVKDSSREAYIEEQHLSSKFGITQMQFIPERANRGGVLNKEEIERVFSFNNTARGIDCLIDFNLLFDKPLISTGGGWGHLVSGYMRTAASNVLSELMFVPTRDNPSGEMLVSVKRIPYDGPVYSLSVDKHHSYVANGIVVGNSSKKIVEFVRQIVPVDNGLATHMVPGPDNPEGVDPSFTQYKHDFDEAEKIIASIKDPENSAVVVRTNRQIGKFQNLCMANNIKYRLLGKSGFWEQNEVKKLIQYIRDNQFKYMRLSAQAAVQSAVEATGILRRYRAPKKFGDNDVAENINDVAKVAARFPSTSEFLTHVNKALHAHKNRKGLILSTVHQMKGKEADHVYVAGCCNGIMPHSKGELPEERRIFFVACSRAARSLHISYFGQPSPFILPFLKLETKTLGEQIKDTIGNQPGLFE